MLLQVLKEGFSRWKYSEDSEKPMTARENVARLVE
jgi:hypothetical protein